MADRIHSLDLVREPDVEALGPTDYAGVVSPLMAQAIKES